jgi:hypothetical protein
LAFHTSADDGGRGVRHADVWWDHPVDIDFHILDPDEVVAHVEAAGLTVHARTERRPWPVEAQTQRCYLLCRRR